MATRVILTSPPVIACDMCGRRLLRGETPDVFVAAGQRRTVCELCVPRAAAEGWLREADHHELEVRPPRPRRGGSLLGRLRQLREPSERPLRAGPRPTRLRDTVEDGERAIYIGSVSAGEPDLAGASEPDHAGGALDDASASVEQTRPKAEQPSLGAPPLTDALQSFNSSELTQRVAGVARSLGAPSVTVRTVSTESATVAIVVAWELCWYRWEVDPAEPDATPMLAAEGMELHELPAEDRRANAEADEHGELAFLGA